MSQTTTQTIRIDGALLGGKGGFDVAKQVVDGRESQWSQEQFRQLPLLDRVRLLAAGDLRFFLKGVEVPAREALRGL
jgi:hypothetical protein